MFLTIYSLCFAMVMELWGTFYDDGESNEVYNPDYNDYPNLNRISALVIAQLRNMLGDVQAPTY